MGVTMGGWGVGTVVGDGSGGASSVAQPSFPWSSALDAIVGTPGTMQMAAPAATGVIPPFSLPGTGEGHQDDDRGRGDGRADGDEAPREEHADPLANDDAGNARDAEERVAGGGADGAGFEPAAENDGDAVNGAGGVGHEQPAAVAGGDTGRGNEKGARSTRRRGRDADRGIATRTRRRTAA